MSAERVDVLAVMDHMIRMHEIESGDDLRGERHEIAHQARAAVAELIDDRRALAEALDAVIRMDVRGHQLQNRLQFSDLGRAILAKIDAASPALVRALGDV